MPILMLAGLPASGKSTYARELVRSDGRYIRINKDDLRSMCHDGKWDARRERKILAMRDAMVETALSAGLIPIVDDTNLHPKHVERLGQIAKKHHTSMEVKFFDVDVEECVRRDLQRPNGVGEAVIRKMQRDFLLPQPEPQDENKPWAIIVDIDGTLAIMGDRSPYDDHLADIDTLNKPVAEAMFAWIDIHHPEGILIVMSGRDEGRSREVTTKWLNRHGIYPDLLLMRPAGDTRKDSIVKRELYDQHVKGNYFIKFVLDDRDQVVRMWRDELGLTCMQVAWGDF